MKLQDEMSLAVSREIALGVCRDAVARLSARSKRRWTILAESESMIVATEAGSDDRGAVASTAHQPVTVEMRATDASGACSLIMMSASFAASPSAGRD